MFAFSAVAVALYLALSAARAADSPAQTIALQPGDNLVGWVAEPKPVTEVFAEIPETSLIYHWDAEERRWAYAIRGVGGNLETLEPGMAVTVRVGGDQTVSWERPLTPAKGGITLYSGVNWVTWLGRDEWPLDQVARLASRSVRLLSPLFIEEQSPCFSPLATVAVPAQPDPIHHAVFPAADLRNAMIEM